MAHQASCRGLPPVVLQPVPGRVVAVSQVCHFVHACACVSCRRTVLRHKAVSQALPVTIQNLYRDPSPCRMCTARCVARTAARVAAPNAVSWHIAAPYRSPDALYRDPKWPPLAMIQYFFFVSRPRGRPAHDTNFVSQHPHLARLCARCASCREHDRVVAHQAPCCGLVCHNTACCIVTQFLKNG